MTRREFVAGAIALLGAGCANPGDELLGTWTTTVQGRQIGDRAARSHRITIEFLRNKDFALNGGAEDVIGAYEVIEKGRFRLTLQNFVGFVSYRLNGDELVLTGMPAYNLLPLDGAVWKRRR
jgi:hypothetical protein